MTSPIVDAVYEPPIRSAEMIKIKSRSTVFLFNPKHQPFIDGKTRRLAAIESPETYFYFVLIYLGLLAAFLGFLSPLIVFEKLNTEGRFIQGNITGHEIRTGKYTSYSVSYLYSLNGLSYIESQSVDSDIYQILPIGTVIVVQYLPEDPSKSRLGDPVNIQSAYTHYELLSEPLFILAVLLLSSYIGIGPLLKAQCLKRNGVIIDGVIVNAKRTYPKGGNSITLKYGFRSPRTERWLTRTESKTEWEKLSESEQFLVTQRVFMEGTPVKILYLNDHMYRVL